MHYLHQGTQRSVHEGCVSSESKRIQCRSTPPSYIGDRNSGIKHPSLRANSDTWVEEEPISMNLKRSRRRKQSLSSIMKRSAPATRSRPEQTIHGTDSLSREEMAWDIINREISGWHDVCQTGRPSWWSPSSKGVRRLKNRSNTDETRCWSSFWHNEQDGDPESSRLTAQRRRVLTDEYAANSENIQDLALLIAVHLLGSCFTLPPDDFHSYKSSAYHCFDTLVSDDIPHSRLISSLRMHTDARYSPSFGHQPRNTSPASLWYAVYDGPSQLASVNGSLDQQSPEVEESGYPPRKERAHRALHVTEDSTADCSLDSHSQYFDAINELQNPEKVRCQKKGVRNEVGKRISSAGAPNLNFQGSPSQRGCLSYQRQKRGLLSPKRHRGHSIDDLRSSSKLRSMRLDRHALNSTIQSEPHPVFIQPVKEMVVKRWQTLRRHFGHSLSNGSSDPGSGITDCASQVSTSPSRNLGSPFLSSDAKERRRQARERHEIHSSGADSTPHYNSPSSVVPSGSTSPISPSTADQSVPWTDNTLQAAASILSSSATSMILPLSPSSPIYNQSPASPESDFTPPNPNLSTRTDSGFFYSTTGKGRSSGNSTTFSPRRQNKRQQRRSMLSEMCIPEDMEEPILIENDSSGIGEAIATERGEICHENAMNVENGVRDSLQVTQLIGRPARSPERRQAERPSITRRSTSGTQVFTPSDEGIELDGLPTGPAADTWRLPVTDKNGGERSFL